MAISQSKYIVITSGIGGKAQTSRKDLIARIFTNNVLVPTKAVLEFTDAVAVANYFGSNSRESLIANEYFGWISKSIKKAKKISFYNDNLSATQPMLISTEKLKPVSNFQAITDGSFKFSLGGLSYEFTGLDFSSAVSYSDIATIIQTEMRNQLSSCVVSYDNGRFIFSSGVDGNCIITNATATETGTDISSLLGWSLATNVIISNGVDATTLQDMLNETVNISNNFATFGFLKNLTVDELETIGNFVDNQNMQYLFCADCNENNYTDIVEVCKNHNGISLNLVENLNNLPAFLMPMILCATTDYNSVNGTINYMFQQFPNQSITVDNDTDANKYDELSINYNGQTQKSGQKINFYQDGFNTNGTDTSVFVNEIWLKDAITTELFNTFLALNKVSYDTVGKSLLDGNVLPVLKEAIDNGCFAISKPFDNTQKAYIDNLLNKTGAWLTLQTDGYIYQSNLKKELTNGKEKNIYEYLLVYSKGDVIRKVEGTNILI